MKYRNRIIDYRVMKVSELTANPKNWRLHPDKQRRALETILGDVGWVGAALYNEQTGLVIDGHLRAKLDDEIPVLVTDLNEEEERKVLATLDPIAALAGHDAEAFQALTVDMDLELSDFFNDEDFAGLFPDDAPPPAEDAGPQMDRAAELQEVWQVAPGDVWEIPSASVPGKVHRLVCGDCTQLDLDIANPVLITDPPYGISQHESNRAGYGTHNQSFYDTEVIAGDDGSLDLSFLFEYERRLIWGFPYIYDFNATGWIVWDKQPGVESRGIVTPVEMAATTLRTGFDMLRVMWGGYYRAAGETREPHPTQKPVSVIEPFIAQWVKESEIVYDPFLGSGTTMVAAERTARLCYGIEIEPKYVSVILQRMQDLGLSPRRVES